jgi:site-specific recombinase XerD
MDLTTLFPQSVLLRETALAGPIGPYLEGFLKWASHAGYAPKSFRQLIHGALEFSCLLTQQGVHDTTLLTQQHMRAFVGGAPPRMRLGKTYRHARLAARAAPHVLRYLQQLAVVPPFRQEPEPLWGLLLTEWLTFLRHHRGLSEATITVYRRHIERFLNGLGPLASVERMGEITPGHIRSFVQSQSAPYGHSERLAVVSTLKQFLGYALECGYLRQDLRLSLVPVPSFKHQSLPRGPKWDDALRLLTTPDRTKTQGRRDYAMLTFLMSYGVRAFQLVGLTLEDIAWRSGTITFPSAKGGRPMCVPLSEAAGKALLDYIERDRPHGTERHVFLSLHAPFRPFSPANVARIVRCAYQLSGTPSPYRGSHSLRHAWATQMLREGRSLKTIADLLDHRQIDTTRIFAKVDLTQLAQVPLPWPVSEEALP